MKLSKSDLTRALSLYAVTDRYWTGEKTLYEQVKESLEGGVSIVQLREKKLDYLSFKEEGIAIQNLNATIREEDRLTLQETVADESDLSPEQRTIKAEVLRELYSGIEQLSERERCYVLYRYGFQDSEDHTLTETANHFHLSESRARGIEETALTHLRDSMPQTFFVNGKLISGEVFSKTILALFEKRERGQFI